MAIATRKVKIKVLNDSKQLAVITYTTTTMMLILGAFIFAIPDLLILEEVTFVFGIYLATTVYVILLFVPKVRNSQSFYML